MKKLVTIICILCTVVSHSQTLSYQDLAQLFSQDDLNGSARFTAMSGAFGALGGDVSVMNVNPAGIAVYNTSAFSGTLNSRSSEISTEYYSNSILNENQFSNISHAGAVLVFKDYNANNGWGKFALGFNYRITKDFADSFFAEGNSGLATFRDFPLDNNDPTINYNVADGQFYENTYTGEINEFNIAFSGVHDKRLYVGTSLNFYELNFSQQLLLTELNSDGSGNELDANLYQENFTTATGFSANFGFIYKVAPIFRLGLSYQTPTWYTEVLESSNIVNNDGYLGDVEITTNNSNVIYNNTFGGNFFTNDFFYRLRTPGKITASTAFIFGKFGLLSVDYSNKFFKNINLSDVNNGLGNSFSEENQFFQNELRNTHNVNIGTEWRFNRFSIRGGYRYEQAPDTLALDSDDLQSYSYGVGYNFGNLKIDLAYSNSTRTAAYNFYPQQEFNVDSAELNLDNRIFTATVSLNL